MMIQQMEPNLKDKWVFLKLKANVTHLKAFGFWVPLAGEI